MSPSSELTLVRLPATVALHARPAGAFVRAAASFTATIEVQANGRSAQRGWAIPITAASATAGCAMIAFSSSTELIHSPPDLIRSLVRSAMRMEP